MWKFREEERIMRYGSSDMLFAVQMSGLFTLDTYLYALYLYLDMSFTSAAAAAAAAGYWSFDQAKKVFDYTDTW